MNCNTPPLTVCVVNALHWNIRMCYRNAHVIEKESSEVSYKAAYISNNNWIFYLQFGIFLRDSGRSISDWDREKVQTLGTINVSCYSKTLLDNCFSSVSNKHFLNSRDEHSRLISWSQDWWSCACWVYLHFMRSVGHIRVAICEYCAVSWI